MERPKTFVSHCLNFFTPIYCFFSVSICRPFYPSRRRDSSACGIGPLVAQKAQLVSIMKTFAMVHGPSPLPSLLVIMEHVTDGSTLVPILYVKTVSLDVKLLFHHYQFYRCLSIISLVSRSRYLFSCICSKNLSIITPQLK